MKSLLELFSGLPGRALLFCVLGWVFDFYDLILFAFVKGMVAEDLGLSDGELGLVDGVTLGAAALGGVVFGRLADRWGRRRTLAASILVYSAGAFMTAFAEGLGGLLSARVITGLGVGGEWGVGHAVVQEVFPKAQRNRAAAVLQAFSPVALMLAALVGLLAAPVIGWRWCFLLSGAPALLVFVARWALPGPDRAPGAREGRLMDLFRGVLRRPSAVLLGVLVLHMTGFWCVYSWLPKILLQDAGLSPGQTALFFVAITGVHVVADVSFGPLADRFGRRRTFIGFCLVFTAGQLLVALNLGLLRDSPWQAAAMLAAMGLGAGTWSCFGVLFALHYPERLRATAASSFYNLARGVQLFTLPMMAWLFAWHESYAPALWIGAACALGSAAAILALDDR